MFPIKPGCKAPPLTEHGLKDATTHYPTINEWWAETPDANIGIACGAILRHRRPGHRRTRRERSIKALPYALPDTLCVLTPRGAHFWFATPES